MLSIAGPRARNPVVIRRHTVSAYVITQVEVTDAARFGEYAKLAPIAAGKYGGRYLARGGETAALEGNWQPQRLGIVEFPTLEQAKRFYDSPEYQEAKQVRSGAANMKMLAVEGV